VKILNDLSAFKAVTPTGVNFVIIVLLLAESDPILIVEAPQLPWQI
jgi:hypothetical protein